MREVIFIEGLKIKKVPMCKYDEIRYQYYSCPNYVPDEDQYILTESNIEHVIVPIHKISKLTQGVRRDIYIAYSKEVDELLGEPIKLFQEELDRFNSMFERASFLQRLKYLFTGKI